MKYLPLAFYYFLPYNICIMLEQEPSNLGEPQRSGLARRALRVLDSQTRRTARRTIKPALRIGGAAVLLSALAIGAREIATDPSQVKDLVMDGVRNAREIPGNIKDTWEVWRQTKEQRAAKKLLEELGRLEREGEIVVVRNVTVGPDGANLRNRPSPNADRIGRLEPGVEIPAAIVVRGKIYTGIGEEKEMADWYAFLNPENLDQVAFSFEGNFEEGQ
jgi:hypothetical protein